MTSSLALLVLCLFIGSVFTPSLVQADLSIGESGSPSQTQLLQPLRLTLKDALAAVLDNNPDVLLYKERILEAQGHVRTQLGAMFPSISADVRQTRRTQFLGTIGLSPMRTDPFSIFDARISATQNLFSLSLIQRWRASRESLRMTEQESDAKRFDMMATVALVYMEGVKAMTAAGMHEANQRTMEELLETVRQRQRGGVATGLDIARLEAQLASERQQGSSVRYDLEHATLSLINLLALPTEIPLVLADAWLTTVEAVPTTQRAVEEALNQRPEIQAQYTRVKVSELTYASITGERVPSLVAQGDYGLVGNRWNNTLDTYNMGLVLRFPSLMVPNAKGVSPRPEVSGGKNPCV